MSYYEKKKKKTWYIMIIEDKQTSVKSSLETGLSLINFSSIKKCIFSYFNNTNEFNNVGLYEYFLFFFFFSKYNTTFIKH